MNEESRDSRTELLKHVLEDGPFREFSKGLKQQALAQFRRGVVVRRVVRIAPVVSGILAILIAALVVVMPIAPYSAKSRRVASLPKVAVPQAQSEAAAIPAMSDKEVLACFPPGSCFMAEVEGRKVLVFPDPVLRQRYLH